MVTSNLRQVFKVNDAEFHAKGAAGASPSLTFSYDFCSFGAAALVTSGLRQACWFQPQGHNPALQWTAARPLNFKR